MGFLLYLCAMVYDLPVEEEKIQPHQVTTLHLVGALAFTVAGAIIFRYNFDITTWGLALMIVGILLLCVTIFKNKWVISKRMNPIIRMVELLIAAVMEVYSIIQYWKFPIVIFGILCAALLFALFWEKSMGEQLTVHIDDEGVKLPVTARRRFIPWTEIEQIILRFGTLSIDCVDNHLFQWNVSIPGLNNETFETFCVAKVEENRDKRTKEDEW